MGTDHSPSSGSDLHRPFHLHSPPLPLAVDHVLFHLESSLGATAELSAAIRDTASEEGGKLGPQPLAAQKDNKKRLTHCGSFLEDLTT